MDRAIPVQEIKKRRRKWIIRIAFILIIPVLLVIFLPRWMERALDTRKMQTGVVDTGAIEITVGASGKLIPLIEEIVVSPVNSRILEVYKNPGDTVNEGEPLLKLDLVSVETEYLQKLDEMSILKSKEIQTRVRLENSISELNMQQQLKDMQLKQFWADLQGEKYLDSIGASTPDKVNRASLNYEEAKLQLQQLKEKITNEQANAEAELHVQQLEIKIFEKTLEEKSRLLKDARILSPKKAVLTFILNQTGVQISQGEQLAIVSDLSRFKVDCEIADGHREKLTPGSKAVIRIGNIRLYGTVSTVTPSVTNGLIRFTVIPEDSSHPSLRSGLNADVDIFHGIISDAVRVPNSSNLNYRKGDHYFWVIENDRAIKRKVRLGESSFEYIEVLSGLSPGERVILSDMDNYMNKKELRIKHN
ncbi:MAG: efflux RND transporter periplasmic adaptor subunit [Dysgonamonadaceae bacterium]|jgi:HlyD family secretion protein|nr:efflux RND transporter periplasmic adaptor subunit [Dysgonamonadaceae bacterium]